MHPEVAVLRDVVPITAMMNVSLDVSARTTTVVRMTTEIAETVVLVTDVIEIDLFVIGLNPYGEIFKCDAPGVRQLKSFLVWPNRQE